VIAATYARKNAHRPVVVGNAGGIEFFEQRGVKRKIFTLPERHHGARRHGLRNSSFPLDGACY
jgi:hypothetical protein